MNEDDHGTVRDELAAFLDGELSATRRRTVATHLRGCVACRAELRRLEGLERLLVANAPQAQPTADFERRFATAFQREVALRHGRIPSTAARRRALVRWARPMWVPLSAAAIAAGATIVFWPDTRPQPAAVVDSQPAAVVESVTAEDMASAAPLVAVSAEEADAAGMEMPVVDPAIPAFLTVPPSRGRAARGFTLTGEPGYALLDGSVVPAAVPQAETEALAQ